MQFSINETKGNDCVMSFCGMVLTNEGILAFADSKATKKNWIGRNIEDVGRHPQKIFKTPSLVIVTTGNNYFIQPDNGNYEKIEDVLSLLLAEYDKMHENFNTNIHYLTEKILQKATNTIKIRKEFQYLFLIGYKEEKKYHVIRLSISNDSCETPEIFNQHPDKYTYICIGDDTYCQLFSHILFEKRYPLYEMDKYLKETIKNLMNINDLTREYNPVGLPLHTELFM